MRDRDIEERFGGLVRSARLSRGISQAELGEMVGTSRVTIHSVEMGDTAPRLTLALSLMRALGIPTMKLEELVNFS